MADFLYAYATYGTREDTDMVLAIFANCLGVARERLSVETSLVEDLGIDSIDLLALAIELDQEFDVVLTDEALHRIRTIGDALPCIAAAFELRQINRGVFAAQLANDEGS